MSFQLIDHFGRAYQITSDYTRIGPQSGNDVVIPEMSGTGTVLTLERSGNYWQLETADPSIVLNINGVSARGVQYLRHLDIIQVNGIGLRFLEVDLVPPQPRQAPIPAAGSTSGPSPSRAAVPPAGVGRPPARPTPPSNPSQGNIQYTEGPPATGQPTQSSGGTLTRRTVAIGAGVLAAVALFAMAILFLTGRIANGPARAAEDWVTAVATSDGATALGLTCDLYRDQVQMSGFLAAGLGLLFGVDTDGSEADLSDLEFNTVRQSGDTATVDVQGELMLSLLGAAMPQQLDMSMTMVREDGQWKYCGDDFGADSPFQSTGNFADATPDVQATVAYSVEATQSALAQSRPQAEDTETLAATETPPQLPDVAPEPLPGADLLWADDFEDGIGDSWSIVFGDWRTSNGYLVPSDDATNSLIVGGDSDWTDYTVSVDIDQFSRLYYAGGVLVRVQDSQNFMRATAYDSVMTHGTVWKIVVDGEVRDIAGTDVSRPMGRPPYNLTIRVNGPKYELYVNGELQSSFTDNTFSQGYIGLQSYGYQGLPSSPHLAGFDNLVVTRE